MSSVWSVAGALVKQWVHRKGRALISASLLNATDLRFNAKRYRSSRARFLGATEDLPVLFSAADVFTLPTIYDPFSNACLEAIAAGLPVVTTTANGFSEILTPGVHGDVVEPGDVEALARALEAWKSRDTAATSDACRILAGDYSIERNVEATLDVIKGLAPE